MRLILVGCEYAGTTTLAVHAHAWAREELGIDLGAIHDHWKIPYTVTHYPQTITEEEADQYGALAPRLQEALQRHNLYYHLVAEAAPPGPNRRVGVDGDQMLVGYHIEDTIYADLYYGYGGPGKSGDRASHSRKIEERIMRLAPETVLVHVHASTEVILDRMKTTPHKRPLVTEGNVEMVLGRFRDSVAVSAIANKVEIDTSDAEESKSAEKLQLALEPFLTAEDRRRRQLTAG